MENFDELEALLNISSNISIQESSNATTPIAPIPFLVEAASSGGAILFSSVGVYMNLVLARSLFKSTLLATSHRRVIRFLAYVHICLGIIISLTSLCWVFRFLTWPILPAPAFLYLVFREISRASLIFCCVERYFYNLNAGVREDKVGKLTLFIRCISFVVSILTTAIFTIFVEECSIDALVPHRTFFGSHLFYSSLPFPMIIILLCLISRIGRKHKLSHGLVAAVRTKKLELERAAIRNCVLPLTFLMSICSAVEILAYFFVNSEFEYRTSSRRRRRDIFRTDRWKQITYLFTPLSFLIYSCRVILFPVAHVIMQPLLREDCRMNIFIWRKLQRRSSEARVRTIMNKESQESIISNFKMIGILTE